jgi:HEAT repeat protein
LTPQQVPAPLVRQVMTDPQLRTALLDPAARQKLAAWLLPSLIVALNDVQPEVRIQATFRIMAFGADAESAIEPLRETLNDEDARVRKIAGAAIVQIQSGDCWSLV